MALAARSRRFALVSDDAPVSPDAARVWDEAFAAMAAELRTIAPSLAAGRTIDIPGAVGRLIDKIAILRNQGAAD